MKTFRFECEYQIGEKKFRKVVRVMSNHLNGAVRKLYQQERNLVDIKKILD